MKEYNDLLEVVMQKLDVVISSVINENSFSGKAKLRYYEALKKTGRTNVNPPSAYGSTIHELGHYLEDDLFGKIKRERKINMEDSFEKYSGNISAYATANRHEYMAESFTAYWNGEKGILDPAIVAVFEEMRK